MALLLIAWITIGGCFESERVRWGRLLPVEFAGPSGGLLASVSQAVPLRVELSNGRRIVVEEGFSATLLKSVIAALEG
jgi:hypothetical protein